MRISLRTIAYLIAAFAGYIALASAPSQQWGTSSLLDAIHSMGPLYGTLLYVSGAFAFFFACRFARRGRTSSQIASAIPMTLIPALIGAIGAIHGHIETYELIGWSGTSPKEPSLLSEFAEYVNAGNLVCLLFGLSITVLCFTILSIALIVNTHRQWKREPSDPPQQAHNA